MTRSQVLYAQCTAKWPGGLQCSVPVFDVIHERPLCDEHARKKVLFLNMMRVIWQLKPVKDIVLNHSLNFLVDLYAELHLEILIVNLLVVRLVLTSRVHTQVHNQLQTSEFAD